MTTIRDKRVVILMTNHKKANKVHLKREYDHQQMGMVMDALASSQVRIKELEERAAGLKDALKNALGHSALVAKGMRAMRMSDKVLGELMRENPHVQQLLCEQCPEKKNCERRVCP